MRRSAGALRAMATASARLGANSISGNNQPLFVLDGIPVDNFSSRLVGFGGYNYGNTAQDINPGDVESITVLSGPNAAALTPHPSLCTRS